MKRYWLLVLAGLVFLSCSRPAVDSRVVIEFGTFRNPMCELDNVRSEFAIDEPMSMAIRRPSPFGSSQVHKLYLAVISGHDGQTAREEINSTTIDVDPNRSVVCIAGPKLTPRQFGIQGPGRYQMELWTGDARVAFTEFVVKGAGGGQGSGG